MEFIRKIIKNKIFVLSICVVLVCIVYFIARKIIDNYEFELYNSTYEQFDEELGEEGMAIEDTNNEKGKILEYESEATTIIEENTNEDDNEKQGDSLTKILVHVDGEVNNPGVVSLEEGTRILDAVNAAGGATNNADMSEINLAYPLRDGMKINIPNKNDLKEDEDFNYIVVDAGNGKSLSEEFSKESEIESNESLNVNINTATQTELESLPGIGPSLALKIINYRKENGKFSSIDELKNVSGIGEAKFDAIKDFVVVF